MQTEQQNTSPARRAGGGWSAVRLATYGLTILLAVAGAAVQSARGQILPDAGATRTTDLIRLAGAYADAVGELKIARLTVDTLATIRDTVVVSGLEISVAKINVQTAERKVAILRAITERELVAAKARLEALKRMEKVAAQLDVNGAVAPGTAAGGPRRSRLGRAEATVKVLEMILAME